MINKHSFILTKICKLILRNKEVLAIILQEVVREIGRAHV